MKKNRHQITVYGVSRHTIKTLLACGNRKSLYMITRLPETIVSFRVKDGDTVVAEVPDLKEAVEVYNNL